MKHKHIIRSLPLLASVLGRKYGVKVRIGGDKACTDGRIIYLPSLPLDGDDKLLGLLRGYTDHESAHIRDTDFAALKAAKLQPLEKHLWNIIEDWRVENLLAKQFPGCRENFRWLIKHLFLPQQPPDVALQQGNNPTAAVLEWLLLTVRSWDVPELEAERVRLQSLAEGCFPGLCHELEPVVRSIPSRCGSTSQAIAVARELGAVIRRYAQSQESEPAASDTQAKANPPDKPGKRPAPESMQSLHKILADGPEGSEGDIGGMLGAVLSQICRQSSTRLQVAVPTDKNIRALSEQEMNEARQTAIALRTRLHGKLQSTRSVRNHNGHAGKLNTRALHRLAVGDSGVFLRRGRKVAVNTAIHVLLDSSGSMMGRAMDLAGQSCFALASALHGIHGVSLGVTAFPGRMLEEGDDEFSRWQTVAPILRHSGKLHNGFGMDSAGNTPLDSALWWALQQLLPMPEQRKIILIVTDGKPDNVEAAMQAIRSALALGLEVYGIGICTAEIQRLLPGKSSQVISSIQELPPALFGMLQDVLVLGGAIR